MTRKLVTIRTVSEVNPIEGADAIECLTVEGWKVVSQKGNFKAGDPCVYFEIDSFLPEGNELWDDLVEKSSREFEGRRGHVLRTIKLRGQVSQGWCIPVTKMCELFPAFENFYDKLVHSGHGPDVIREADFSELIGVVKYDPPLPAELAGAAKGLFPSFIRKTDQERLQNIAGEVFADLDARYEVTIKLDGSSCTVYYDADEVGGVCSRNLELNVDSIDNDGNTFVRVAKQSKLLQFMKDILPAYAVQGELMGPGIQGNRENLKAHELFIFDIFDIAARRNVDPVVRGAMFELMQHHGIAVNHTPILHEDISLRELGFTEEMTTGQAVTKMLELAEGRSLKHDIREGLVFKRLDGLFSFKCISNRFLLKQKE